MNIILIAGFIAVNLIMAWSHDQIFKNHVKRSEKTYMGIGLLQERFKKEFKMYRKEAYRVMLLNFLLALVFLVLLCLRFYL